MLTNKCFLIYLKNTPIYQQLLVEEALLRCDSRNICLININPPSSIVLGISCNPIEDLFIENVLEDNIPVVRRYSGGGTVYLDQDTIMVSWIISENKPSLSPQDILLRSYTTYAPIFPLLLLYKETITSSTLRNLAGMDNTCKKADLSIIQVFCGT